MGPHTLLVQNSHLAPSQEPAQGSHKHAKDRPRARAHARWTRSPLPLRDSPRRCSAIPPPAADRARRSARVGFGCSLLPPNCRRMDPPEVATRMLRLPPKTPLRPPSAALGRRTPGVATRLPPLTLVGFGGPRHPPSKGAWEGPVEARNTGACDDAFSQEADLLRAAPR